MPKRWRLPKTLMARKGGAVAGVVGSVVQRVYRSETGEEDQSGAQQAAAQRQNQALRQGQGEGAGR